MTTQSKNNKIYIKKKKNNVNPAHSESAQAKKKKKQPAFLTQKKPVKK